MKKQRKFLIGGVTVAGLVGYLMVTGMQDSMVYYHTPTELLAKSSADAEAVGLQDPVHYQGPLPDTFQEGSDVVVEGRYTPGGGFEATTVLTKCGSRYEAGAEDYQA